MSVERLFMSGKRTSSENPTGQKGITPNEVKPVSDFYQKFIKKPKIRELLGKLARR